MSNHITSTSIAYRIDRIDNRTGRTVIYKYPDISYARQARIRKEVSSRFPESRFSVVKVTIIEETM